MPQVVTRFAPSPTGYLHIGGARTALFSYLFARANSGKFLLRIEDTDRARSTQGAIDAIIEGLNWLGLSPDETPVFQFARAARHTEIAHELVKNGKAYYCNVSAEELSKWRESHPNQKFRSPFRDASASEGVVRLKAPLEGKIIINDKVKGEVPVDAAELDDMVLLRSDGTPTYMLAVVVDDHDMGITHVIRGDDHFTNTFRQKLIYDAMEWDIPEFAHVPLIHGADGAKLSKRHGALGVEEYQKLGYLPEALRNYLLRLGWSHGDDEIISDEQAIKWFNLENLGKSPARFDFEKLNAINSHYMRELDRKRYAKLILSQIALNRNEMLDSSEYQEKTILLENASSVLKMRAATITASAQDAKWLFQVEMDEKAKQNLEKADKSLIARLIPELEKISTWNKAEIEQSVNNFMAANSLKLAQIGPALRALLTGTMQSPAIFDVMAILGKEEVLKRLK